MPPKKPDMALNTLYLKSPTKSWVDFSRHAESEFGWIPKLWVGQKCDQKIFKNFGLNPPYYVHDDAMMAKPPIFAADYKLHAVDAQILDDLSWHQPIVQEMCNRWFINPDRASSKTRMMYYNQLVENWLNIFKCYEIDLVICPAVPHRIYDYVAYMVATYLKVPFLMINATAALRVVDGELVFWHYLIDDVFNRTNHINENFLARKHDIKISESTRAYTAKMLGTYEAAKPKYFKEKDAKLAQRPLKAKIKEKIPYDAKIALHAVKDFVTGNFNKPTSKYEFQSFFHSKGDLVKNPNKFTTNLYHRRIYRETRAAKKWLEQNASSIQTGAPYILFAASKQPERSTCPDAGHFQNHHDIIATLAEIVPADWKIYYKEHPSNYRKPWVMDSQRSISYYERLKEIAPNLSFLPLSSDPFEGIDKAKAIATATGSMAWEALLRGKPSLIFGSVWYESCPGIFKVNNLAEARQAITKVNNGYKPDHNEVIKFVEFFNEVGENISWYREPNFGIAPGNATAYEARVKTFAQAYKKALDRYFERQHPSQKIKNAV